MQVRWMLDGSYSIEENIRKNLIQFFTERFIQQDLKMFDTLLDRFAPALMFERYKRVSLLLCDVMVLHLRRKIVWCDVISFDENILILHQFLCLLNFFSSYILSFLFKQREHFFDLGQYSLKLFFTANQTFGLAVPAFKFQFLADSFV